MTKLQPHFLQSEIWADFQHSIGRETVAKTGDGWSYMAVIERGKLGNRLYCPYGPTVVSQAALRDALANLKTEAKARKIDFIRVEPRGDISQADLAACGLKPSHHYVQPTDTAVLKLDKTPDEIIAGAVQNTRNIYRRNMKKDVTYEISYDPVDIRYFLDMIHQVAARTGMKPLSDFYFSHVAKTLFPAHAAGLMFAIVDGKRAASLIFYTDGHTMSYAHGAAFDEFRKLSPATGLIMNAILFAKESGCEMFDFYGISPVDAPPTHSLYGITKFKLSFGATRIATLGTWELPVRKFRYRIYKTVLKLAGK